MEKTKSRPRRPAGESDVTQETGTASVTEKQIDAAAEKQTEGDEEKEIEEDWTQTSTAENSETRE